MGQKISCSCCCCYCHCCFNNNNFTNSFINHRLCSNCCMKTNRHFVEENHKPIILKHLQDQQVQLHETKKIFTRIISKSPLEVIWFFNNINLATLQSEKKEKYKFSQKNDCYFLKIRWISFGDCGLYTCLAKNSYYEVLSSCFISINAAEMYKKPTFLKPLNYKLDENGKLSLECSVTGNPLPKLSWFKDKKKIHMEPGSLFPLITSPDQKGYTTYTCKAANCCGEVYSSNKIPLKFFESLTNFYDKIKIDQKKLYNVVALIDQDFELMTQIKTDPKPKAIFWYLNTKKIEFISETNQRSRYDLKNNPSGTISLIIKKIEMTDSGDWKCVIIDESNGIAIYKYKIFIKTPKNYIKPQFLSNLKAKIADDGLISFECKVIGFPTPRLYWFKDDIELKPGDLHQLNGLNSLGMYCCLAKNCMGEEKSLITLTINDFQQNFILKYSQNTTPINVKQPIFITDLKSFEANILDEVELLVEIKCDDNNYSFQWFCNNKEIHSSEKYQIYTNYETLQSSIKIRPLELIDEGQWKCLVQNSFGKSVTICNLKLRVPNNFEKPKFLNPVKICQINNNENIILECKISGNPVPVMKWFRDDIELNIGDTHVLNLKKKAMLPLGKYTCEAKNCMGTEKRSIIIFSNPNNFDDATVSYQTAEQDDQNWNQKTVSDCISNDSDEIFLSYAIEDSTSNYYAVSFPMENTNHNEINKFENIISNSEIDDITTSKSMSMVIASDEPDDYLSINDSVLDKLHNIINYEKELNNNEILISKLQDCDEIDINNNQTSMYYESNNFEDKTEYETVKSLKDSKQTNNEIENHNVYETQNNQDYNTNKYDENEENINTQDFQYQPLIIQSHINNSNVNCELIENLYELPCEFLAENNNQIQQFIIPTEIIDDCVSRSFINFNPNEHLKLSYVKFDENHETDESEFENELLEGCNSETNICEEILEILEDSRKNDFMKTEENLDIHILDKVKNLSSNNDYENKIDLNIDKDCIFEQIQDILKESNLKNIENDEHSLIDSENDIFYEIQEVLAENSNKKFELSNENKLENCELLEYHKKNQNIPDFSRIDNNENIIFENESLINQNIENEVFDEVQENLSNLIEDQLKLTDSTINTDNFDNKYEENDTKIIEVESNEVFEEVQEILKENLSNLIEDQLKLTDSTINTDNFDNKYEENATKLIEKLESNEVFQENKNLIDQNKENEVFEEVQEILKENLSNLIEDQLKLTDSTINHDNFDNKYEGHDTKLIEVESNEVFDEVQEILKENLSNLTEDQYKLRDSTINTDNFDNKYEENATKLIDKLESNEVLQENKNLIDHNNKNEVFEEVQEILKENLSNLIEDQLKLTDSTINHDNFDNKYEGHDTKLIEVESNEIFDEVQEILKENLSNLIEDQIKLTDSTINTDNFDNKYEENDTKFIEVESNEVFDEVQEILKENLSNLTEDQYKLRDSTINTDNFDNKYEENATKLIDKLESNEVLQENKNLIDHNNKNEVFEEVQEILKENLSNLIEDQLKLTDSTINHDNFDNKYEGHDTKLIEVESNEIFDEVQEILKENLSNLIEDQIKLTDSTINTDNFDNKYEENDTKFIEVESNEVFDEVQEILKENLSNLTEDQYKLRDSTINTDNFDNKYEENATKLIDKLESNEVLQENKNLIDHNNKNEVFEEVQEILKENLSNLIEDQLKLTDSTINHDNFDNKYEGHDTKLIEVESNEVFDEVQEILKENLSNLTEDQFKLRDSTINTDNFDNKYKENDTKLIEKLESNEVFQENKNLIDQNKENEVFEEVQENLSNLNEDQLKLRDSTINHDNFDNKYEENDTKLIEVESNEVFQENKNLIDQNIKNEVFDVQETLNTLVDNQFELIDRKIIIKSNDFDSKDENIISQENTLVKNNTKSLENEDKLLKQNKAKCNEEITNNEIDKNVEIENSNLNKENNGMNISNSESDFYNFENNMTILEKIKETCNQKISEMKTKNELNEHIGPQENNLIKPFSLRENGEEKDQIIHDENLKIDFKNASVETILFKTIKDENILNNINKNPNSSTDQKSVNKIKEIEGTKIQNQSKIEDIDCKLVIKNEDINKIDKKGIIDVKNDIIYNTELFKYNEKSNQIDNLKGIPKNENKNLESKMINIENKGDLNVCEIDYLTTNENNESNQKDYNNNPEMSKSNNEICNQNLREINKNQFDKINITEINKTDKNLKNIQEQNQIDMKNIQIRNIEIKELNDTKLNKTDKKNNTQNKLENVSEFISMEDNIENRNSKISDEKIMEKTQIEQGINEIKCSQDLETKIQTENNAQKIEKSKNFTEVQLTKSDTTNNNETKLNECEPDIQISEININKENVKKINDETLENYQEVTKKNISETKNELKITNSNTLNKDIEIVNITMENQLENIKIINNDKNQAECYLNVSDNNRIDNQKCEDKNVVNEKICKKSKLDKKNIKKMPDEKQYVVSVKDKTIQIDKNQDSGECNEINKYEKTDDFDKKEVVEKKDDKKIQYQTKSKIFKKNIKNNDLKILTEMTNNQSNMEFEKSKQKSDNFNEINSIVQKEITANDREENKNLEIPQNFKEINFQTKKVQFEENNKNSSILEIEKRILLRSKLSHKNDCNLSNDDFNNTIKLKVKETVENKQLINNTNNSELKTKDKIFIREDSYIQPYSIVQIGKYPIFKSHPEKKVCLLFGDDFSISCRIQGNPRPQVMLLKGTKDITNENRSYKWRCNDYVRFTVKRITYQDEGTYCILAKNIHGCDRSFTTLKIKK